MATVQCASCMQPMLIAPGTPPGSQVACPTCTAPNLVPGPLMMGQPVGGQVGYTTIIANACPPHKFVDTREPSAVAWIICLLTCFCCSLCICTRRRCTQCGITMD